jgi:hypothetical protein
VVVSEGAKDVNEKRQTIWVSVLAVAARTAVTWSRECPTTYLDLSVRSTQSARRISSVLMRDERSGQLRTLASTTERWMKVSLSSARMGRGEGVP